MKGICQSLLFSSLIIIGCNSNEYHESRHIDIINDVFLELVGDVHKYQTYEDFEKEYHSMVIIDSLTYEQLYAIYNNRNKKVLENGKILLNNHLKKLNPKELQQLHMGNLYDEFVVDDLKSVEIDISKITKKGNYEVLNGASNNLKVGNGVSRVDLSRAYFNTTQDKAILFFEIFCGEYCYEKKIITVQKEIDSGRWVITNINVLEIA